MSPSSESLTLIHEGWDHLRRFRPFAAWASWRRALRVEPENLAAKEALDLLASSPEVALPARTVLRFRPPGDDLARQTWDDAFGGRVLADLEIASAAFLDLVEQDPLDMAALYNLAVCLAWRGENRFAIDVLEEFVATESDDASAIHAWTTAEVLRQGGGVEDLADDRSYTLEMSWNPEDGDSVEWLSGFAILEEVSRPIDPASGKPAFPEIRSFEWFDRPMPAASPHLSVEELPRARISVIVWPESVRFSSPDDRDLWCLQDDLEAESPGLTPTFDARSVPLPLILLDAAVWRFRLPQELEGEARASLTREAIERYFEDSWIMRPRIGLTGLTPQQAAWKAASDPALKRKLAGIINMREAIAARVRSEPLYAGYPFDRLRRRVGLPPNDPNSVDPTDVSCMSELEFQDLDLKSLDELRLLEAHRSAWSVCRRAGLDRIEAEIVARGLRIPEEAS